MYANNRPKDVGYKNYNSDENEKKSGKSSDNYDLLDIWRVNPRYRDLDTKAFTIKGSVSIILLLAIAMSFYFLTMNIYLTVSLIIPILFVYFFDQGKRFLNKVFNLFNKAFYVNPFRDLAFFVVKDEPSTFLLVNKKVSSTVALRVFKVEVLPENLQPTLNQFLKSLYNSQLSFSYQVSHKPIIDLRTQKVEGLKENEYLPNLISFKAVDKRDIAMLKNQMNLQELHGTGYYSSKRNNTYQIDYLMNLQGQEVIIKRADVSQPFPGIIGFKKISELDSLSPAEIIAYMKRQGYDLEDHEQRIIARAKQTFFEKDLGIYVEFMEDIISFLGAIKRFDKVAGLTESKIKEELLKYVRNTALKRVQGRKQITELRNSIFQILKTQGYLVEDHPRRASGSESTRTCYKVGDKYRKAVDDFCQVKGEDKSIFVPNAIKNEGSTNFGEILATEPPSQPFSDEFKKVYEDVVQSSYVYLYYIGFLIKEKKYQKSLKSSMIFVDSLFSRLYEEYLRIGRIEKNNFANREPFINGLVESKLIPYTNKEIQEYMEISRDLGLSTEGFENNAVKLYEILNQFYNTLVSHIKRR